MDGLDKAGCAMVAFGVLLLALAIGFLVLAASTR